jgi:hypothetical protein
VKLKYEQFEGISAFSIRGRIESTQVRLLAIGLETLVKDLQTPLIVNLGLADIDEAYLKTLLELKKILSKSTRQKLHWVGTLKGLCEFKDLGLLFSRLNGFKIRQIGERLKLEGEIHLIYAQVEQVKAQVEKLGGDESNAHKIILENRILREQQRILKNTISLQVERMKLQKLVPTQDSEYAEKVKGALEALKSGYGSDLKL